MTTKAREFAERATAWTADQPAVRGVVIFGSVAQGVDSDYSDLDLILVAEPGRRQELWDDRVAIAAEIMGTEAVCAQEPSWQAQFRYQVWDADLHHLDLTIAEGSVDVFGGITRGFEVLVDRGDVEEQLTAAVQQWSAPEFDAEALDPSTWPWLMGLQGRLRHGQRFAVRAGVVDTLMGRVVPMLGGEWHTAESQLSAEDMQRVHDALPRSGDVEELSRSLLETARVYDWALDRWAERTGRERPRSPLAPLVLARLADPAAAPTVWPASRRTPGRERRCSTRKHLRGVRAEILLANVVPAVVGVADVTGECAQRRVMAAQRGMSDVLDRPQIGVSLTTDGQVNHVIAN